MRLTTILGGARKQGNTATLLGWVEQRVRDGGHEITRVNLDGMKLRGCRGCYACMQHEDRPGCVQQDDAYAVYQAMIAADALLLASPLYMWEVVGPMKTMMDRCLALATGYAGAGPHRSLVEGARSALLVCCGGGIDGNADAVQMTFPRWEGYLKLSSQGIWIFPNCTTPDRFGKTERARCGELANRLTAGLQRQAESAASSCG